MRRRARAWGIALLMLLAGALFVGRELTAVRHAREAGVRAAKAIEEGEAQGRAERAEKAREDGLWKDGT